MSLHRQYKELQSRSQKALDMMYEDLAAQQKAASASIASIESENDALWAHIEGLEEAVFVDPQVISNKFGNQQLLDTHMQLLQGRRKREVHTRKVEEVVLKLRCENELLRGRVKVAEDEFLELARAHNWNSAAPDAELIATILLREGVEQRKAIEAAGLAAKAGGLAGGTAGAAGGVVGALGTLGVLGAAEPTVVAAAVAARKEKEESQRQFKRLTSRLQAVKQETAEKFEAVKRLVVTCLNTVHVAVHDDLPLVRMLETAIGDLSLSSNDVGEQEGAVVQGGGHFEARNSRRGGDQAQAASSSTATAMASSSSQPKSGEDAVLSESVGAKPVLQCGTKISGQFFHATVYRDDTRNGFDFKLVDSDTLRQAEVFVSDFYASYVFRNEPALRDSATQLVRLNGLLERMRVVDADRNGRTFSQSQRREKLAGDSSRDGNAKGDSSSNDIINNGKLEITLEDDDDTNGDTAAASVKSSDSGKTKSPAAKARGLGGDGTNKSKFDASAGGKAEDDDDDDDDDDDMPILASKRRQRRGSIMNPNVAATVSPAKIQGTAAGVGSSDDASSGSTVTVAGATKVDAPAAPAPKPVLEVAPAMTKKNMRFLKTITRQDTFSKGFGDSAGGAPVNPLLPTNRASPAKHVPATGSPTTAKGTGAADSNVSASGEFAVPRPRKRRGKSKRKLTPTKAGGGHDASDEQDTPGAPAGSSTSAEGSDAAPTTPTRKRGPKLQSSDKKAELAKVLGSGTQEEELAKLKRMYKNSPAATAEAAGAAKDGADVPPAFTPMAIGRQDTFGSSGPITPMSQKKKKKKGRGGGSGLSGLRQSGLGPASPGKAAAAAVEAAAAVDAQKRAAAPKPTAVPKAMKLQRPQRQDTFGALNALKRPGLPDSARKEQAALQQKEEQDKEEAGRQAERAAAAQPIPTATGGEAGNAKIPVKPRFGMGGMGVGRQDTLGSIKSLLRPKKAPPAS